MNDDHKDEAGSGDKRARAGRFVRAAMVPGGNQAIDYTTRTLSRDFNRFKGSLPSLTALKDDVTGANAVAPDSDHDYSLAGIKPEYLIRFQRNAVVAWWLYAAIGLMGLFSLSIGFSLIVGGGSGTFLIIVNTLLCGTLGSVSGALLSLKAGRDLRLMTTGERLPFSQLLMSADAWLPIGTPGFMEHTRSAFPVIAVVLMFLLGGPLTLFLLVKTKAGLLTIALAVSALGFALYGLRRWVVRMDTMLNDAAASRSGSSA